MKDTKEKKLIFWAGFSDDKIDFTIFEMPAIYKRKEDAKRLYEDVRKIEIKIINN